VLVDRNHKRFPIAADFVGVSLATTLQEHITVELDTANEGVYLS
jgi:pyrimidine operon attenuation protein/uracil phosphoribosyltransferase